MSTPRFGFIAVIPLLALAYPVARENPAYGIPVLPPLLGLGWFELRTRPQ